MKSIILILGFLYTMSNGLAQTGPGGVGSSANNGLWLKADDITQANNSPLSVWPDASGNGNNANQVAIASNPNYFTTSSLNGMPVVRLDGIDDQMAVADAAILDGTSGITFYAVIRPSNLNGNPRGILGKRITYYTSAEYAYTWFFQTGNRLNLDVNTQNNRFNTGATTFSNATNYILSWDFDGTLAAPNRSRIRTGSTTAVTAAETSTVLIDSNQDLAIGALNVNYGTYLGADYAEIIHFNYALDPVDHILVQNYLSAKYNIAIATNDLYDEDDAVNGNFDFDVAGIGQLSSSDSNIDAQGSGIVRMLNPNDLDDNEFLIWGHNNAMLQATNTSDVPTAVKSRFERVWRVSEVNNAGAAVDTGAMDIHFDLTGVASVNFAQLRLLIDTDNDGVFDDETPIGRAILIAPNVYAFNAVTALINNSRFTIGLAARTIITNKRITYRVKKG